MNSPSRPVDSFGGRGACVLIAAGAFYLLLGTILAGGGNTQSIYPKQSRYQKILTSEGTDKEKLLLIGILEDRRVTGSEELLAFMEDPNPLVRLRAAQAIHRIGDPGQLPVLIRHLRDSDYQVSLECIFGVGQFRDPEAAPALKDLVNEGEREQDIEAMLALGKIGDRTATELLVRELKDFSADVRFNAALALALMADSSAVESLHRALYDDYDPVVWASAYALEKIPHKSSVGPLLELLDNDDELVRSYAVRTLGRIGEKKAAAAIRPLVHDASTMVSVRAMEALGRLEDGKSVEAIADNLSSDSYQVRRAAADALGQIGKKEAREALVTALRDPSPAIRSHAVSALAKILEEEAAPYLRSLLNDEDRTVRAGAVYELARIASDEDSLLVLRALRTDPDPLVRSEAARALGENGTLSDLQSLAETLEDEDWVVRAVAAEALGKIGDERAIRPLLRAFQNATGRTDADTKLAVVKSIGEIGSPAVTEFLETMALWDPDVRVRRAAAAALSEITGGEVEALDDASWKKTTGWSPPESPIPFPPLGTYYARIVTDRGTIRIRLLGDDAPNTVGKFILRAREGAYDGLTFHRVVPNFVAQGGDPRGDGWGDMGYNIRSEWNRLHYTRGTVGIAHSGKDTGGCQFFITHSPQPHLDGRYTIFARVVEGQDVVEAIEQGDRFIIEIEE